MSENVKDKEAVRAAVRAGYAEIAQHGSERRKSSCCCGMSEVDSDALARHIGYTAEELAALPGGANIGLSCGNPRRGGRAAARRGAARPGERGGIRRFHGRAKGRCRPGGLLAWT